ncbi:hypothetical protein [Vibrio parahaemolyticus]|uniref:hypothetical protein n=1 Tax=Vibrio parahaemolyticus TaxID=670 RepID=UPI00111FEFD7|nr:hypothetical protein [Vibrio parahaemolyticus]EJG1668014.1 hypothetical protein [Vibrio parahaemolyticus]EJG1776013.1 hypothetical protein [Vibrio parahaemolyticus]TOJ22183.1 hypothetical protein CGI44_13580 [Vibrio parahaemolyticus]TOJ56864.1 hypothetical protein CGI37_11940 [Vibrio parahaemolyticus]
MKYEITIRKLEPTDLSNDCRFPNTDIEDYVNHKEALLEDLKYISSNIDVSESDDIISIKSTIEDKDAFWDSVKDLFFREKENIKFVIAKEVT